MIHVLFFIANVVGASSGIGWTDDYSEALTTARCEGRPMLVVLENREKAKERAGSIFHVEPKLLTQFEICRVDVGSDYGKKVADQFSPSELPYTVITDNECEQIVFRGVGERTIGEWTETLEDHSDEPENGEIASNSASAPPSVKQPAPLFQLGELEMAKKAAAENSRHLIVFVSMDNCAFCDKMTSSTFSDDSVTNLLAKSAFETVTVKKENYAEFVSRHEIAIYPSTLVFSPEGNLLKKIDGYVDAAEFTARLNSIRQ